MAQEILAKVRAYHEAQSAKVVDYVFPGKRDATTPNFFARETEELRHRAKLTDFMPHDLRRWASTAANAHGCQHDWVERYLDHEIGGVAGIYNLYDYEAEKRTVAYAIENKVREARGLPAIAMP
jgi:integrase